ncbi:MAG: exo-alpha-sialidase [Victivallales bacterium]|nr:exo-alpha-sialidase [Victivallales bacterium]
MKIKKNIVICSKPYEKFGYFGWPSIARQADGTIFVAASGLRYSHVCPWGRTIICKSSDNGETWTEPRIINNTPLDDRDAGIISLGGQRLAITWFTSNTLHYFGKYKDPATGKWAPEYAEMGKVMDEWDGDMCEKTIGSWLRVSPDGEYWGPVRRAPVNTPHGFIVLKDGSWLYLGKEWLCTINGLYSMVAHDNRIVAVRSTNEGRTWQPLGIVPFPDGITTDLCHEPHVVELDNGELLGAVRVHNPFRTMLTRSSDGGKTWSVLEEAGINGAPPHLLKHSSGAIVCVFGYRSEPYGERAKVSYDNGHTWSDDIILRDDGPSGDLGYPASIELDDGSIMTIYYQLFKADQKCSLMGTIWKL